MMRTIAAAAAPAIAVPARISMRNSISRSLSWALAGVVFMFIWTAASGSASQERLEPAATVAQTAPATPDAYAKWVKLGELVPMETDGTDVYVRLIAIEGDVLLPVDHVR